MVVVSCPGLGRADFFCVYGEFNSSQGGYIATASNVGMAAVFNMASGVITFDTLVAGHGAGSAAAGISSSQAIIRNDTSFFVTGQAQQRYLTYTNPALSKKSFGSVKPGSAGTTGACFWFDDREFYVSGEDRYGVLQLFDITDGISSAKVVGTPTPALGSATNSAVTAPVCVEVFANHVMIYVMATNNGIAAYRLAAKEEPSSITTVKDDALMVYVREGAIVAQAAAGNTVSIYNTLGQLCAEKRVDNAHEVVIEGLAPQQIYIVKIGRKSVKVVL